MSVTETPDTRNGHATVPAEGRRTTGTRKARSEAAAPAETMRVEVDRAEHARLAAAAERTGLTIPQAFALAMDLLDAATEQERQETAEERRARIVRQFRGEI
jgi:hypothetical protein